MKTLNHYLSCLLCVLVFHQPLQGEKVLPFAVLNCPTNSGFFAIFSSVLSALDLYDKGHYAGIKIDLNSGIYLDSQKGSNWWEYFFEPICVGDLSNPVHVFSADEVISLSGTGFRLSRARGFELIQKYVHLTPQFQEKLDKIVKKRFKDYAVIGVHYRGTDKKQEASLVPYPKILKTLNRVIPKLSKNKTVRIFVATDEQKFITFLLNHYPGQVIYNDFVRSTDGKPLHYSTDLYANNYQKGKEALLDCLLLSRCDHVIFHAASAFGIAVLKFNPHVPAIALTGD